MTRPPGPTHMERVPRQPQRRKPRKAGTIFKPAAEAVYQQRLAELGRAWPPRNCLPLGPAQSLIGTYRIIQSPTVVALLFNAEVGDSYRQIFLDGRELPRDPNPTWRGYSVGHWEGDTLVVDVTNFNDRTWFDKVGDFHSDALHVVERYSFIDKDHLDYEATIDDPKVFTKTWSPAPTFLSLRPGERLHEYECIENNEDIVRFEQLLKNESLFRRQP